MVVAVLSLVFSILFIWYSRNTGQPFWLYWAPFLLAAERCCSASRSTEHSAAR